jgi:UPF0755 protein
VSEWSERTDEEREAARLERERRRAGRSGQITSPKQAEAAEPAIYPEDHADPAALHGDQSEPEIDEEDSQLDDEQDEDEVPAGTRRISHLQRQRIAQTSARPPPRTLRPAKSRDRKPHAARRQSATARPAKPRQRRHLWFVRAIALLALLLAGGLIWFLVELLQPFHGSGQGGITVTIPPHSTASQVGDLLERDGVIASGFFFDARATLAGDRSDLRSGTYQLKLDMPYSAVLTALTTPPKAAKVSDLTIIEGDTRAKVAVLLRSQHIRGSYLAATRRSPLINLKAFGAPRALPSLEGFLLPSTYQLRDPIRIGDLVSDQLRTFKQRFATVNLAYARSKHLTPFDVLTIASMVQGEAQTLHDMPLIASVIYNRLRDGMLLGIDATTRYATGNFTRPLTNSQLNSRSPYNTRIHPGLPLGPINNPGLAAIEAAAHPARTNYLYFVAKVCGNGASAFASNNAQFQREAEQYQAARAARGGKSPTHC